MDKKDEIPLLKIFPKLKKIPRISIINTPTPVKRMVRTSKILGDFNVWIKRDDLTHEQYGGNKPRKYEFVFVDALKKKKTRLLTIGGIGTNHGLATTIHFKELGFETHLYLIDQSLSQHVRENLLCHHYFGAKLYLMKNEKERNRKMRFKSFIDRQSYFMVTGASTPLGTLGFVNAGLELAEQVEQEKIPEPDKIFVAAGSLATCAGLILGLELAGMKTRIIGINITSSNEYIKERTLNLARNALEIMLTNSHSEVIYLLFFSCLLMI
ncbi:MAG: pyridoxal-phosphate dependent enzyme [Candidatus Heimdallarchaeota archaeon]|nr:pyridoxal-phosphate dependent enzyme [Candidatus Heimdallarchaeota archaeon]MCK4253061.1 pyridoxal-phosphate dependent enzyme [Candidatus Heimdallarchaeota archaeon]